MKRLIRKPVINFITPEQETQCANKNSPPPFAISIKKIHTKFNIETKRVLPDFSQHKYEHIRKLNFWFLIAESARIIQQSFLFLLQYFSSYFIDISDFFCVNIFWIYGDSLKYCWEYTFYFACVQMSTLTSKLLDHTYDSLRLFDLIKKFFAENIFSLLGLRYFCSDESRNLPGYNVLLTRIASLVYIITFFKSETG